MILGLKVKYAKPGSLPMDSAFVLLKDKTKKDDPEVKIKKLEAEIAKLKKECLDLSDKVVELGGKPIVAEDAEDAEADHVRPAPVLRPVTLEMMKPRKELDGKSCEVTFDGRKVNIVLIDVIDISQNYSADGWESMEVTLFDGWSTDKILIHDRRDAEVLLDAVLA